MPFHYIDKNYNFAREDNILPNRNKIHLIHGDWAGRGRILNIVHLCRLQNCWQLKGVTNSAGLWRYWCFRRAISSCCQNMTGLFRINVAHSYLLFLPSWWFLRWGTISGLISGLLSPQLVCHNALWFLLLRRSRRWRRNENLSLDDWPNFPDVLDIFQNCVAVRFRCRSLLQINVDYLKKKGQISTFNCSIVQTPAIDCEKHFIIISRNVHSYHYPFKILPSFQLYLYRIFLFVDHVCRAKLLYQSHTLAQTFFSLGQSAKAVKTVYLCETAL